ncbi:MAG: sigma-70 family RNA polymerase sigma factor [Planctomycetia bacterium]|nr:sigma-70 family RNA polymerase sigma factor [Planctomycetia bacterium]
MRTFFSDPRWLTDPDTSLVDPDRGISANALRHDLGLIIEDLFDEADVKVEEIGEKVWTTEKLAEQFSVSTKTISRWRSQGLVSRRLVFPGGRKRVGFPESSVRMFEDRNPDRIRRGAAFTQMSESEVEQILKHARRFAERGGCPSEVVRRVAGMTQRSEEAVRYTIQNHDRENEDEAIFPDHNRRDGDVREETRLQIYDLWRRGRSPEQMVHLYRCFSKTRLQRIITEVRLPRISEFQLDYFGEEEFRGIREGSKAEAAILASIGTDSRIRKPRVPEGLPPYLASLYEIPLLTREQEYQLFRKMSWLRYRASRLREKLNPLSPRVSQMDEIERLNDEAIAVKNQIIQANLRLVVSIAKHYIASMDDFFGLVSDGNMSLMRAVEKFDFTRGNKFSTYASWAIRKNFARTIPEELRRRDRSSAGEIEFWEFVDPAQRDPTDVDFGEPAWGVSLETLLESLEERERQIIMARYGLGGSESPMTLTQVGEMLGVTKERVRQIESRAMDKLRRTAAERVGSDEEIPGFPTEGRTEGRAGSARGASSRSSDGASPELPEDPQARFSFFGYDDLPST